MYSFSLLALSALPVALAASASSTWSTTMASASASSTSSAIVVKVGDGGLNFSPSSIKASVGDVVEFHFYPEAHSVAQASFDEPCNPLNTTGFFSGPVPVSTGVSDEVFRVTVSDSSPIWFYCATASHCQSGMVGVINAPTTGSKTLKAFAAAAAKEKDNVAPSSTGGGKLVTEATGTSTASATSGTSTASAGSEARGDVRWGMLTFGVALAGFVGGLAL